MKEAHDYGNDDGLMTRAIGDTLMVGGEFGVKRILVFVPSLFAEINSNSTIPISAKKTQRVQSDRLRALDIR